MDGIDKEKLNKVQIEQHLKSAMSVLTPSVLDKIDLKSRQELYVQPTAVAVFNRRFRVVASSMAACLCVLALSCGGTYLYQNGKVDSVIGLDINPSIEISVNRRNKVLEAHAINEDAYEIIEDMELKGVDLNVAVNAVIGSMVQHGYLDDLDNAILVTVSNDSVSKADSLRQLVVGDIQASLMENQVEAVVYDQQVIEVDEIKLLADQYGISYGKAYFLEELITQNPDLSMADMGELAPLSMEEIAESITEGSYALAGNVQETEPVKTTAAPSTEQETTAEQTTVPETALASTTVVPTLPQTQQASTAAPETTAPPETTQEVVSDKNNIKIDNVDYDSGIVYVNFTSKVKWSNPTVSVKDEDGNAYSAMVGDYDSTYCEIRVSGLEEGRVYTFVLGGIKSSSNSKSTTVKGTFETPVISSQATEATDDNEDDDDDSDSGSDTKPVPDTTVPPAQELPQTTTAPETAASASGVSATASSV